jgi:hypothetical protein
MFMLVAQLDAAEFRFKCLAAGTTGLSHSVYDDKGKETMIVLTKDSDSVAREILAALIQKQVSGTKGVEDHEGAKWEQGIILVGDFASKTKLTKSGPNTAPPEKYRDFRITGIKVLFPVSRFEVAGGGNPIDGPMIIETHFSFDSLFPHGVILNGKPIDLSKHATKRRESK